MKNYNLNQIDFNYTALVSNSYPSELISLTDTIEFYMFSGDLAESVKVANIIDWIGLDNDFDALIYLDQNWDNVTESFYKDRKELKNVA